MQSDSAWRRGPHRGSPSHSTSRPLTHVHSAPTRRRLEGALPPARISAPSGSAHNAKANDAPAEPDPKPETRRVPRARAPRRCPRAVRRPARAREPRRVPPAGAHKRRRRAVSRFSLRALDAPRAPAGFCSGREKGRRGRGHGRRRGRGGVLQHQRASSDPCPFPRPALRLRAAERVVCWSAGAPRAGQRAGGFLLLSGRGAAARRRVYVCASQPSVSPRLTSA